MISTAIQLSTDVDNRQTIRTRHTTLDMVTTHEHGYKYKRVGDGKYRLCVPNFIARMSESVSIDDDNKTQDIVFIDSQFVFITIIGI